MSMLSGRHWRDIPLSVKLFLFILFFSGGVLRAAGSYAQHTLLKVDAKEQRVSDVLAQIESQSDFDFFFNDEHVDLDRIVTITSSGSNVFAILDELFKGTAVKYAVHGKKIVLSTAIPGSQATQQAVEVRGHVTDATGVAIIGASVVESGNKSNGVITDIDGNFILKVSSASSTIEISYIGYVMQILKVQPGEELQVVMQEDNQVLDEVVVVGFGSQKKVNLTGAVSAVTSEQLASRPVSNVSQALQGLVPGMNFGYSGDGGKLNQDMSLNIRGTGTIGNDTNASPLILIDGMEGNMNALNPQDIESISVLKDASASSIYGSRAAFGVVLITTKRGQTGKVNINYNNNFRWSQAINMPHVTDSYTYMKYMNRMHTNDGQAAYFEDWRLQNVLDYMSGKITTTTEPNTQTPSIWDWIGNTNTDWYDEVFGGSAFSQEHSLSVNGGTEKLKYYFSANFMDQDGLIRIRRDNLKRYTVTGRIDAQLFPWLQMAYSTKYIRRDYMQPTALNDNTLYHNIAKRWPMEPVYDPNGYTMSNTITNPILYGGDATTQTDWLYQQFSITAEPIKNWRIIGELNYKTIDGFSDTSHLLSPQWDVAGNPYYTTSGWNSTWVSEASERTNYFNTNVYTDYMHTFNDAHHLKVMFGFQAELNKYRRMEVQANDLISEEVPNMAVTTGDQRINEVRREHWATAGFFGRVNYDYKERYLAEVNLRYDGTSRFARDKRWNLFPSFSLGWNIAREAFMEDITYIVNNLKLRGSWGELGNQNTTNLYPYIQVMNFVAADATNTSPNWLINGARPNTANAPALISAMLGWETMRSWNIGFDLGMFNNRLNLSLDYFNRQTLDMVGPGIELPVILGAAVPRVNNADLRSTGFELDLSWQDRVRDFAYSVHFTLSDDRQKILRYPNPTNSLNTWRAGQYIGEIWGMETIGIAKTQEEMDAHLATLPNGGQTSIGSNWGAGDIMYKDLNGDGRITSGSTLDDPGDRRIIGNNTPRFRFGLDLGAQWKGFDLRVFFQGVMKRDAWLGDNMFWGANGGLWQSSVFESHLDYFRPEGDPEGANLDAYFPRPLVNNYAKNQQVQTRYLQNAAYMRLKNLTVGYTLPGNLTRKAGLSNVRIFFSAENLFTVTGLPDGFDPETIYTGYGGSTQNSNKGYPLQRTFSTGISVNF